MKLKYDSLGLVSFDFRRLKDPVMSLGHASILANLKSKAPNIAVTNYNMNINDPTIKTRDIASELFNLPAIGIGVYIWNENYVQRLLSDLKKRGYNGDVILGGPQITYAEKNRLESYYPEMANYFVRGNGEDAMIDFIHGRVVGDRIHIRGDVDKCKSSTVGLDNLASPVLAFPEVLKNRFLRYETQRGCPFKCTFCQHKDYEDKRSVFDIDRIRQEIKMISKSQVRDIAVLDPTFNTNGDRHIEILEYFFEFGYKGKLSLQCRFEMVKDGFVEVCQRLKENGVDLILEFGLQTTNRAEMLEIKRMNNLNKVVEVAGNLHSSDIPFEVSMIYGLPHQTLSSFRSSLRMVQREIKPTSLVAWPLMILRGTGISSRTEVLKIKERVFSTQELSHLQLPNKRIYPDIPHVVSTLSFEEQEWLKMAKIDPQKEL